LSEWPEQLAEARPLPEKQAGPLQCTRIGRNMEELLRISLP
jgi:hypothetical protein